MLGVLDDNNSGRSSETSAVEESRGRLYRAFQDARPWDADLPWVRAMLRRLHELEQDVILPIVPDVVKTGKKMDDFRKSWKPSKEALAAHGAAGDFGTMPTWVEVGVADVVAHSECGLHDANVSWLGSPAMTQMDGLGASAAADTVPANVLLEVPRRSFSAEFAVRCAKDPHWHSAKLCGDVFPIHTARPTAGEFICLKLDCYGRTQGPAGQMWRLSFSRPTDPLEPFSLLGHLASEPEAAFAIGRQEWRAPLLTGVKLDLSRPGPGMDSFGLGNFHPRDGSDPCRDWWSISGVLSDTEYFSISSLFGYKREGVWNLPALVWPALAEHLRLDADLAATPANISCWGAGPQALPGAEAGAGNDNKRELWGVD